MMMLHQHRLCAAPPQRQHDTRAVGAAAWQHRAARAAVRCSASAATQHQHQQQHQYQQQHRLEQLLAGACSINRTRVGLNVLGVRGLLAAADIQPGELVLRLPLHHMLLVPRQPSVPAAAAAAASAVAAHQQHHQRLPDSLAAFLTTAAATDAPGSSAEVAWESKLAVWLLHLRRAAPADCLWGAYVRSLPPAGDTLSFVRYSADHAEQLQLSTWKALAHKQRQLLQTVTQQCRPLWAGSGTEAPTEADVAWALSMVKSRTFGQQLPGQGAPSEAAAGGDEPGGAATHPGTTQQQSAAAAPAAAELQGDSSDGDVVLLMAPFLDLLNHSNEANCCFAVNWRDRCFEVHATSSSIAAGQELTISYGSNKSNLALLSCYGFQMPGNLNDAQLLAPMFASCLAAADGSPGFDAELLRKASASLAQQQQQPALGDAQAAAARQQCALSALPQAPASQPQPSVGDLQLQRYAAQLMLYQVQQMLRLCGSSAADDAAELQQLQQQQQGGTSGSDSDELAGNLPSTVVDPAALQRQVLQARLKQKLLLAACEQLCEQLVAVIERRLSGA